MIMVSTQWIPHAAKSCWLPWGSEGTSSIGVAMRWWHSWLPGTCIGQLTHSTSQLYCRNCVAEVVGAHALANM